MGRREGDQIRRQYKAVLYLLDCAAYKTRGGVRIKKLWNCQTDWTKPFQLYDRS